MRFQLTRQHVHSAADLTVNSVYAIQALLIQGLILVFVLALFHNSPEKFGRILLVSMIVSIIYFLPKYLLARRGFIKVFTVFPEFSEPMDVEVVNGELVIRTAKSTSAMPREWINQVKSNELVTVLYRSSIPCFIIPIEVVKADEGIRTYLETKPMVAPKPAQPQ